LRLCFGISLSIFAAVLQINAIQQSAEALLASQNHDVVIEIQSRLTDKLAGS